MSRSPRDSSADRVADATAKIYEALDSRLNRLDTSLDKFRDEMRTDIRALESSNSNIDRSIQQMQGANVSGQVTENKAMIAELEKRIRSVESFQSNITGRLLIIGAIAMVIASILGGIAMKMLSRGPG